MFDFENILLWILAFDKTILIPNIAIFKYFGFWSFTVLHLISLIREYISQNEPCISIAIYVVYFIHKHWNIILFWLYLQLWLRYLRSLFIAHTQNLLKMYNGKSGLCQCSMFIYMNNYNWMCNNQLEDYNYWKLYSMKPVSTQMRVACCTSTIYYIFFLMSV